MTTSTPPTTGNPQIPEAVYRNAAVAAMREHMKNDAHIDSLDPEYLDWLIDTVWLTPQLRATVESAYPAGILAAQRVAVTTLERERLEYGATKAGEGIFDFCRVVVRRALDELAGGPAGTEIKEGDHG